MARSVRSIPAALAIFILLRIMLVFLWTVPMAPSSGKESNQKKKNTIHSHAKCEDNMTHVLKFGDKNGQTNSFLTMIFSMHPFFLAFFY